jgi:DNA repair exonuclease SbcCD ATPase subunit
MSKIDEIKEELMYLEQALEHLEKAMDEYESIDWPDGVPMPHHVMMEMEQAHSQMDDRKQEIEDKLERI